MAPNTSYYVCTLHTHNVIRLFPFPRFPSSTCITTRAQRSDGLCRRPNDLMLVGARGRGRGLRGGWSTSLKMVFRRRRFTDALRIYCVLLFRYNVSVYFCNYYSKFIVRKKNVNIIYHLVKVKRKNLRFNVFVCHCRGSREARRVSRAVYRRMKNARGKKKISFYLTLTVLWETII